VRKLSELFRPRAIIGLIIIAVGLLIMLENLGISIFDKVLGNWPLALIIIGAAMIYGPNKGKSRAGPIVLIGLGSLFLLAKYDVFQLQWHRFIVPVVLIIVGLYFLRPRLFKPHGNITQDNQIEVFSVLGGGEFSSRSPRLVGGHITCILGGANIDISEADMESDTIEIDVLSLMGGADIKVPTHWQVNIKAVPLLGGVSNRTTCLAEQMQLPRKTLVINGYAIMGGIDVKN
jgi:hypothetical protein